MVKELVYFITVGDVDWRIIHPFIKIGRTNDLPRRLKDLSCASPIELIPVGSIWAKESAALERMFHRAFQRNRRNGEWFELDPNMVDIIRGYSVIDDRFDELFSFNSKQMDSRDLRISALERALVNANNTINEKEMIIEKMDSQIKSSAIYVRGIKKLSRC
jgi:hypothetical protein